MPNKTYTTTIRFHLPAHIKMIEQVKTDYYPTSLSKALIHALRELYELKQDMAKLRKAVKKKYEIDSNIIATVLGINRYDL